MEEQVNTIFSKIIDHCKSDSILYEKLASLKLNIIEYVNLDEDGNKSLLTVAFNQIDKSTKIEETSQHLQTEIKDNTISNKLKQKKLDETEGTLKPFMSFMLEKDCEILIEAIESDAYEKAIINILPYRSKLQRQEIVNMFKTNFEKNLEKELKHGLNGSFCDVVAALCKCTAEYDAIELHDTIEALRLQNDTGSLVEILCNRSNQEIQSINEVYERKNNIELKNDVMDETSGHYKDVLISQITGTRNRCLKYDINSLKDDAKILHTAKSEKWKSKFNKMICNYSFADLRTVFKVYKKISNKDIEDSISSEFNNNNMEKQGLLATVSCIKDTASYFAKRLQQSIENKG